LGVIQELHSGPAPLPLPLPDPSTSLGSYWKHPRLSGPVAVVIWSGQQPNLHGTKHNIKIKWFKDTI
jgi:hypothetical protein